MPDFLTIEFETTDRTTLRGRFYQAQSGSAPAPVIVMAHGFAGVVELRLEPFAEAFAAAGFSVLVYDHRNFGASDGEVRQEVDPYQQIADWRDAITFALTLPGVDPDRVGIWGSSLAGGHVIVLGATDARVKCVVSQVPFISGSRQTALNLTPAAVPFHARMLAEDRSARMRGEAPRRIPVVSNEPGAPAALATPEAFEWTERWGRNASTFRNDVTLRSIENVGAYEPGAYIGNISPKPLLVFIGKQDNVTQAQLALEAYAHAREPKDIVLLEGGHFCPYDDEFEVASGEAIAWFQRHLGIRAPGRD